MEQILWYIAIPTTIFYLMMSLMTLFTGDIDVETEVEADTDSDGSSTQFFTLRNLLSLLLGLSWGSLIGLKEIGLSEGYSFLLGLGIGVVFTLLQMSLFYFIMKFEQKQEPNLESALNKEGTCYLSIPQAGNGHGKVTVTINGSSKTLTASTDGVEIPTGSNIKVVAVNGNKLKVIKI